MLDEIFRFHSMKELISSFAWTIVWIAIFCATRDRAVYSLISSFSLAWYAAKTIWKSVDFTITLLDEDE